MPITTPTLMLRIPKASHGDSGRTIDAEQPSVEPRQRVAAEGQPEHDHDKEVGPGFGGRRRPSWRRW